MPGPNVRNAVLEKRTQDVVQRQVYFLTDPTCQEIHGIPVTEEMRKNGIILTASEAMTLIAGGAITSDKAHAASTSEKMQESINAMREAQAAEIERQRSEAEASGAVALHNAGERVMSPGEVDALMNTTPENKPADAKAEPNPALTSEAKIAPVAPPDSTPAAASPSAATPPAAPAPAPSAPVSAEQKSSTAAAAPEASAKP